MSRKKYKSLAYAMALATALVSASAEAAPEADATQATEASAETAASATAITDATETADATPAADSTAENAAPATEQAQTADAPATPAEGEAAADNVQEWVKNRPTDELIVEYMQKYTDKTVVDIVLDGASEATLLTVKTAMSMSVGDTFTATAAEEDRQAILNTGYFYDVYPIFEEVPEGIVLTYRMLENPILKDVKIEGNQVETDETLYPLVTMRRNEILNNVQMHDNVRAIQEQYRKDGYIFAKITDMNFDRDGVLTLKINEGSLEGYKVKGNTKTKERVITREMRTKIGEPFNAKDARRSLQRLQNLGFFDDVNLKPTPGVEPNAIVLEIDVKEKRTGSFGIGAGYSSQDGILGMVSIGDTNFRGTGDAINLTYERSGSETDSHGIVFAYRRPWLDKKETAATLRYFNRTYRYYDYDTEGDLVEEYMRRYVGGEITLSRPMSEYSTNYVTFRQRDDQYVRHVSGGSAGDRSLPAYKNWRDNNFGITRSVTLQHVTDTRDNIYTPTTGGRVALTGEVAGLGGDFDFQKVSIEDTRFFPVGHAQVVAVRGMVGAGHGEISEFNLFKLGGQDSLRGYRDDQYRGTKMVLGTVEYRFPLASKVQGAIFTDWGSAWSDGWSPDGFHGSIGVGLALNTPLGPLRLDYGRGQQGGRVHFSVGGSF
ncbi:MAG: BamA/TamA family outer membrane protein [Selenomonadaceae bacterium]|nr:BamA/TamA family outer membrane protein [Selenomonadaceae bacterium]